jgi:hypothetical protein
VALEVFDAFGQRSSTTRTVAVVSERCSSPPEARIAANVLSGEGPLEVAFVCQRCDEAHAYEWRFGDGATSTEPQPVHRYQPGRYRARLTLRDADGCAGVDEVEVVVSRAGEAPPQCRAQVDPVSGPAPLAVRFTAYAQGGALQWRFDDGALESTAAEVRQVYDVPGAHRADLIVTSPSGLSCRDAVAIEVLDGAGRPSLQIAPLTAAVRCSEEHRWQLRATEGWTPQWSLRDAPAALSVDAATGEVRWRSPVYPERVLRFTAVAREGSVEATRALAVPVECEPLRVGCGCGATGGAPLALLGLLKLARGRRAGQRGFARRRARSARGRLPLALPLVVLGLMLSLPTAHAAPDWSNSFEQTSGFPAWTGQPVAPSPPTVSTTTVSAIVSPFAGAAPGVLRGEQHRRDRLPAQIEEGPGVGEVARGAVEGDREADAP